MPEDQPIIERCPRSSTTCDDACRPHFDSGAAVSRRIAASRIEVRPRLVRGLDYYMRTTFEIVHGALGAQNSVLGGGRYDGLAEALGSKVPAPGIGFSIGEDRLVMTVEEADPDLGARLDVFIAPLGEDALRHAGSWRASFAAPGSRWSSSPDKKLKRALEVANKTGARYALIVGDDEIAAGTYTLKNMTTGEQEKLQRDEHHRTVQNAN